MRVQQRGARGAAHEQQRGTRDLPVDRQPRLVEEGRIGPARNLSDPAFAGVSACVLQARKGQRLDVQIGQCGRRHDRRTPVLALQRLGQDGSQPVLAQGHELVVVALPAGVVGVDRLACGVAGHMQHPHLGRGVLGPQLLDGQSQRRQVGAAAQQPVRKVLGRVVAGIGHARRCQRAVFGADDEAAAVHVGQRRHVAQQVLALLAGNVVPEIAPALPLEALVFLREALAQQMLKLLRVHGRLTVPPVRRESAGT